jgi:hypothetical protein
MLPIVLGASIGQKGRQAFELSSQNRRHSAVRPDKVNHYRGRISVMRFILHVKDDVRAGTP